MKYRDLSFKLLYILSIILLLFRRPNFYGVKYADIVLIVATFSLVFLVSEVKTPKTFVFLVFVFVPVSILSTVLSPISFDGGVIYEFGRIFLVFSIFTLTYTVITNNILKVEDIYSIVVITGIFSSLLSITTFIPIITGFEPPWSHLIMSPGPEVRAMPFYYDPNYYASVLLVPFSLSFIYVLYGERRSRLLRSVIPAILFVSIVISGSRSGVGGAVISFSTISLIYLNNSTGLDDVQRILVVLFIFLIGIAVPISLLSYFRPNSELMGSFVRRVVIWKDSILVIGDKLLLGVGPSNYIEYINNGYAEGDLLGKDPHNMYLSLISNYGLLGFTTITTFILVYIKCAFSNQCSEVSWYHILPAVATLSILSQAMFLDMFTARWLWFAIGMTAAVVDSKR